MVKKRATATETLNNNAISAPILVSHIPILSNEQMLQVNNTDSVPADQNEKEQNKVLDELFPNLEVGDDAVNAKISNINKVLDNINNPIKPDPVKQIDSQIHSVKLTEQK